MTNDLILRSTVDVFKSGFRSGSHFRLPDTSVAYSYIRKNACSSFTRFILKDVHANKFKSNVSNYNKMVEVARMRTLKDFLAQQHRIFVYRDPLQRIASLYLNKFVQQKKIPTSFVDMKEL